jgi:putative methyltransferase (TIGR04325 family)
VDAGIQLARTRDETQLEFTIDYHKASGADLLISTGALQLIDVELVQLLAEVEQKPRYILINNVPFTESTTYYTINNIGPSFCPYRILSRPELLASLEQNGYSVLDTWQITGKKLIIPFHPEQSLEHYGGMLLGRQVVE